MSNIPKRLPANTAALLLRLGLAGVFLYAAISSLVNPEDWVGFLPAFLLGIFDGFVLAKLFAVAEIVLALWLLSGWQTRWAALSAAALLIGILAFSLNLLIVTFRDFGLILAALALAVLSIERKTID